MRGMARPDAIRSYALFGEWGDLPDVLHCETIAARSALHGWELALHRHARLHQLLLVRRGGGTASLEGGDEPLRPMTLVNMPAGDVHGFRFAPGTQGWVVTMPDELVAAVAGRAGEWRAALDVAAVVPADAGMRRTMAAIAAEHDGRGPARPAVLRGLAATVLALAARALLQARPRVPAGAGPRLMQRFEALLDAHHADRWGVADYARALAVTPTHLTRVARETTGRSAARLAEERLMREARRQLAFTALPVKTIAYTLGYADPAHFTRAFTRVVGRSPRAFRTVPG